MRVFCFALAFAAALTDWILVVKQAKPFQYLARPAVLLALFAALLASGGLYGARLWFGLGALFSLAGDLALLPDDERWFLPGMGLFLLAQAAYVLGLNMPSVPLNLFTLGLALMIGLSILPLTRRILFGLARQGRRRWMLPAQLYASVGTLLLFSALMTLFRVDWASTPALLVSLGGVLFVGSDVLSAWDRFVAPVRNGPAWRIAAYHLAQMALIAGAILQFSKFVIY